MVSTPIVWDREQTVYPEAIHHDNVDAEMRRHPRWEVPGVSRAACLRVRAFRQPANVWWPTSCANFCCFLRKVLMTFGICNRAEDMWEHWGEDVRHSTAARL